MYRHVLLGLIQKELRVELRGREIVGSLGLFTLLSLALLNLAFQDLPVSMDLLFAGSFWVTLSFGSVLGAGRSIGQEWEERALYALSLLPADRSAVYLGKVVSQFLFLLFTATVASLIGLALFRATVHHLAIYVLSLGLTLLGLAVLGILQGLVVSWSRARELLLPLLLLPLSIPLLLGAIRTTTAALQVDPLPVGNWFSVMGIFDFLFLSLGLWLFEEAMEG